MVDDRFEKNGVSLEQETKEPVNLEKYFTSFLGNNVYSKLKSLKKKVLGGKTSSHLIKTYFVYIFVAILMVITKAVIARLYGREELGVYSYFFAIASFLFLISSFEFPEALTQLIVKDKKHLRYIFWLTTKWMFLTSIITIFGLFIVNKVFNILPVYTNIFLAFVVFMLLYTVYYQFYSVIRGDKQFAKSSAFSLVWRVLFVIGIIIFAVIGLPFWQVLFLLSLCVLIAAVTMLPDVIKIWKSSSLKHSVHNTKLEQISEKIKSLDIWKLAFALFLVQVGFYSLRTIDLYFLERLLSFSEVGYYSAYASITNIIRMLAYVFPVVVLPMAAVSSYKIRRSLFRLVGVILPVAILVFVLTMIFVPILYGQDYAGAYWLSFALVASASILLVYSYCSSIFAGENNVGSKYLWVLLVDFLFSIIGNIVLNYYLILKMGIVGAPVATAIVVFVKTLFLLGAIKWFRIKDQVSKNLEISD